MGFESQPLSTVTDACGGSTETWLPLHPQAGTGTQPPPPRPPTPDVTVAPWGTAFVTACTDGEWAQRGEIICTEVGQSRVQTRAGSGLSKCRLCWVPGCPVGWGSRSVGAAPGGAGLGLGPRRGSGRVALIGLRPLHAHPWLGRL